MFLVFLLLGGFQFPVSIVLILKSLIFVIFSTFLHCFENVAGKKQKSSHENHIQWSMDSSNSLGNFYIFKQIYF